MAPLVSPFCSPLSCRPSRERAGVPAGKQSRPIAARPYQRWTNRGRARRAKMNGSLSPSARLSLRSSRFQAIPRAHFPHLGTRTPLASSLAPRIPGVLRPSDGPYIRLSPVQSRSPRCLIPCNVSTSHTVFSVLLQVSPLVSLFLRLSLSFLSFSISRLSAVFLSRFFLLFFRPSLRNYFFFFFLDLDKAALFRISASYTLLVSYSVCISPKTLFF